DRYGNYIVLDVVFFFFQAEDGIRDGHVTGVQTCALPISARGLRATSAISATARRVLWPSSARSRSGPSCWARSAAKPRCRKRRRSEERRVGKECRSRWAP